MLAKNLRRIRIAQGMGQRGLAAAVGVSQPRISEIENGRNLNPRLGTLRRLADGLGISVLDLLEDEEGA